MAKITVNRVSHNQYVDMLRDYRVSLDGYTVGYLDMGCSISFDVTPGRHKIKLHIDWCTSNTIEFEVIEGEDMLFECGGLLGYKLILAFWYSLFRSDKYLWIKQLDTEETINDRSL